MGEKNCVYHGYQGTGEDPKICTIEVVHNNRYDERLLIDGKEQVVECFLIDEPIVEKGLPIIVHHDNKRYFYPLSKIINYTKAYKPNWGKTCYCFIISEGEIMVQQDEFLEMLKKDTG